MVKKIVRISVPVVAFFLLIIILLTSGIDNTPYPESDYYRQTCRRADSLATITFTENDSIYAGFARVSITPVLGSSKEDIETGSFRAVPLAGYGDRKGKPATGIHDSIFIKAAALRSGTRLMIILGADLLIIPPNIADTAAAILSGMGISRDQLYFTATHSHSSLGGWGPGYLGKQFAGEQNQLLCKWLSEKIVSAVNEAVEDLKPAMAGSGIFASGKYTRNRLTGENGTKNDDFSFIVLNQAGGRRAVIGSFSAHATTLGDENMEVSGDYPGYWERMAEKGGYDVAIFCAGSVGSQSPAGEGAGFEKARYIGESLADSMKTYVSTVKMEAKPDFSAASLKISLPEYHIRITTKRSLSSWLSGRLMKQPRDVRIQALRLGKMVWISVPADFSGEYALQFKNSLSARGFLSNITSFNGNYVGYVIPGKYFYMDEYESKIMGWFGPSMGDYMIDIIERMAKIATAKNQN